MENAGIGHNNPPSDKQIIADAMKGKYADVLDQAAKLADTKPQIITSDEESGAAADQIKQINNVQKKLEQARKDEKEPYLRKGQLIDAFFADYKDELTVIKTSIQRPLDEYQREKVRKEREAAAERERIAREEAEEKEQLAKILNEIGQKDAAAQAIADADKSAQVASYASEVAKSTTAELSSVRGETSQTSLRKSWEGEIVDVASIDLEKLRPYLSLDALQKALNSFIRAGGRECAGTKIVETYKSVVR